MTMPPSHKRSELKDICDQRRSQGAVCFSKHAKHRKKLLKCVDSDGHITSFLHGTKLIVATKNLDWHYEHWKRDKTLCRFWAERAPHYYLKNFNRGSFLCTCKMQCVCHMQTAGLSP